LRYKRVSTFNVLDSKQSLLIDLINLQTPRDSIVQTFASSFNVSLEEAEEALDKQISGIINEAVIKNKTFSNTNDFC
jgi:hypothetical protein